MIEEYITPKQESYELLDAGDGMKLERFGEYVLARPDPEALFPKKLGEKEWGKADARFIRKGKHTEWILSKKIPASWIISYGKLRFEIKPTSFKHVGLFPEQLSNWVWLEKKLKKSKKQNPKILNLFGYTGGASLVCAKMGAEVTHVDGSKSVYGWARKNQDLSGLSSTQIRWLIDDSISFLKKEIKRGVHYDGIVMDPPSFGHGPNGELWKIEEHLVELFSLAYKVLSDEPLFFLINGYSSGYSVQTYRNNLLKMAETYGGVIETGELLLECSADTAKKLPAGIVVRWSSV